MIKFLVQNTSSNFAKFSFILSSKMAKKTSQYKLALSGNFNQTIDGKIAIFCCDTWGHFQLLYQSVLGNFQPELDA